MTRVRARVRVTRVRGGRVWVRVRVTRASQG